VKSCSPCRIGMESVVLWTDFVSEFTLSQVIPIVRPGTSSDQKTGFVI
jgi:hypothetical protein